MDKYQTNMDKITFCKRWAIWVAVIGAMAITSVGLIFDTDLGKMIVSNGTDWVNMDGTALS